MRQLRIRRALGALCLTVMAASGASAQVFGTFTWQTQPFCNRVVLTMTSVTGTFTLDGFDDQCGAPNKASAVGVGTFNAAGNVTLNFTLVTAPAGKPVHVSAVVSTANGNGTWSDSVGNTGTFVLAGAVPGLPVRPLPASGLAPASITANDIAGDSIGSGKIIDSAVGPSKIAPGAVGARHLGTIATRTGAATAIAAGGVGSATASCLAGEEPLSGGNLNTSEVVLVASRRFSNGWVVFGRNDSTASRTITAQVNCLLP